MLVCVSRVRRRAKLPQEFSNPLESLPEVPEQHDVKRAKRNLAAVIGKARVASDEQAARAPQASSYRLNCCFWLIRALLGNMLAAARSTTCVLVIRRQPDRPKTGGN
jgi:hypothetical protein